MTNFGSLALIFTLPANQPLRQLACRGEAGFGKGSAPTEGLSAIPPSANVEPVPADVIAFSRFSR
jgi:hypothetical protein